MHVVETRAAGTPGVPAVSLESVIATDELFRRTSRAADFEAESRALSGLAAGLGTSPQGILQKLVDTALVLCRAHSSGISLIEEESGDKLFRWRAVAGTWATHVAGTMPRLFSPCGIVVDRDAPQLFVRFDRYYPYFSDVPDSSHEALMVPFHVNGKAVGAIWVVAHDNSRQFDAEDCRLLSSIGNFASAAYSLLCTLERTAKIEASLKESEEQTRLAFAIARLGTWSWQPGLDVVIADARCREICGLDPNAALSFTLLGPMLHADDRTRIILAIQSASSPTGTGQYAEDFRFNSTDGKPRWVVARGQMRFETLGGNRRAALMVGTVLDITQRKASEEALHEAHRMKDVFLATLAHELRNPLAPIRNSVQILKIARDRNDNSGAAERAGAIMERQLAEMTRLIDDLLDVSRISQGKIELRIERVDIASIVERALETSRPMIDARQHTLVVEQSGVPAYLYADAGRLAQVIANLLNNAAKYTEKEGHIVLKVSKEGNNLIVSVKDDGIGIGAELMPRIFDIFIQGDSSLEKAQGGLGVGLSIARKLVELHGGRIEVHSEGKGSEFIVTLPGTLSRREVKVTEPSVSPPPPLRRRILVVDDNRDAAESLSMMLELMGNETQVVHGGMEALDKAPDYRPDVVLLDIGMPNLNGYETARRMRKQPWATHAVLIALTGWGQPDDRRRSKEAGFNHHLVKPVDPASLQSIIDVAVASAQTTA